MAKTMMITILMTMVPVVRLTVMLVTMMTRLVCDGEVVKS